MEDGIYQMSATENLLVLIVIGLWLVAVINLARKLERICNPPSIYPAYSTHNKASLNQSSSYHEQYSNDDSIVPMRSSTVQLLRATSEPTIDASPRTTILIRSPSETFAQTRSSISDETSSINQLDKTSNSNVFPMENKCTKNLIQSPKFVYPKRIPSIVRRSLLDLHRRTLSTNNNNNNTSNRYFVKTTTNKSILINNGFPLMKKLYRREHTIDEDVC